jgi:hypothetical protein
MKKIVVALLLLIMVEIMISGWMDTKNPFAISHVMFIFFIGQIVDLVSGLVIIKIISIFFLLLKKTRDKFFCQRIGRDFLRR